MLPAQAGWTDIFLNLQPQATCSPCSQPLTHCHPLLVGSLGSCFCSHSSLLSWTDLSDTLLPLQDSFHIPRLGFWCHSLLWTVSTTPMQGSTRRGSGRPTSHTLSPHCAALAWTTTVGFLGGYLFSRITSWTDVDMVGHAISNAWYMITGLCPLTLVPLNNKYGQHARTILRVAANTY